MTQDPNTAPLSPSTLLANLVKEQAGHVDASRLLERERDELLLAKHTGDEAAAARSDAIRADLQRHAVALHEIGGLVARLQPRVALEGKRVELDQGHARAARLLETANASLAAVHQVDVAIEALRVASNAAAPLINAFVVESADMMAVPSRTMEQQAVDTMIAVAMGPLRPLAELIEDRLQSLMVLQSVVGSRPQAFALSQTVQSGCIMLLQRVQDRLKSDERNLASLALEVEQRPDALRVVAPDAEAIEAPPMVDAVAA